MRILMSYWWLPVALAGAGSAIIWLSRCRHPYPSLQPALRGRSGDVEPARWLCHDCGKSWEAKFERAQTPVVRYVGFDQSKAVEAARRARELELRQRELAVDRAGLSATPSAPVLVHGRRAV